MLKLSTSVVVVNDDLLNFSVYLTVDCSCCFHSALLILVVTWLHCAHCKVLAVVLATFLHLNSREAERFHHFLCSLTPVGGAKGQHGQGQGKGGQREADKGAQAARHML